MGRKQKTGNRLNRPKVGGINLTIPKDNTGRIQGKYDEEGNKLKQEEHIMLKKAENVKADTTSGEEIKAGTQTNLL